MTLAELRTADIADAALVERATPTARSAALVVDQPTPIDVAIEYLYTDEDFFPSRPGRLLEKLERSTAISGISLSPSADL
jgi:hypothetical protein